MIALKMKYELFGRQNNVKCLKRGRSFQVVKQLISVIELSDISDISSCSVSWSTVGGQDITVCRVEAH